MTAVFAAIGERPGHFALEYLGTLEKEIAGRAVNHDVSVRTKLSQRCDQQCSEEKAEAGEASKRGHSSVISWRNRY